MGNNVDVCSLSERNNNVIYMHTIHIQMLNLYLISMSQCDLLGLFCEQ